MQFSQEYKGREQAIAAFFSTVFSASEGAEEGALIGELVRRQLTGTAERDLHVLTVTENGALAGGAIFTRLAYPQDERTVFVLGPLAVATERQGRGIGRQLIAHGLGVLREAGVDIAMTYGDPAYYCGAGFRQVTEDFAAAPFRLQHPEGWLIQPLTGRKLTPLNGPARCVSALDDPVFW